MREGEFQAPGSFEGLPPEILKHIIHYMDRHSLNCFERTCTKAKRLLDELGIRKPWPTRCPLRANTQSPQRGGTVNNFCFSRDGSRVAACVPCEGQTNELKFQVWDQSNGLLVEELCPHVTTSPFLCFSPDNKFVVACLRGLQDVIVCRLPDDENDVRGCILSHHAVQDFSIGFGEVVTMNNDNIYFGSFSMSTLRAGLYSRSIEIEQDAQQIHISEPSVVLPLNPPPDQALWWCQFTSFHNNDRDIFAGAIYSFSGDHKIVFFDQRTRQTASLAVPLRLINFQFSNCGSMLAAQSANPACLSIFDCAEYNIKNVRHLRDIRFDDVFVRRHTSLSFLPRFHQVRVAWYFSDEEIGDSSEARICDVSSGTLVASYTVLDDASWQLMANCKC